MQRKDYVKPNTDVLSLYTDEFMGSVLKPSCKSILLSTQFHKPI